MKVSTPQKTNLMVKRGGFWGYWRPDEKSESATTKRTAELSGCKKPKRDARGLESAALGRVFNGDGRTRQLVTYIRVLPDPTNTGVILGKRSSVALCTCTIIRDLLAVKISAHLRHVAERNVHIDVQINS